MGSGGEQDIGLGGAGFLTKVASGGLEVVSSGGAASEAMVSGEQDVYGVVSGSIVSGGTEDIFAGGIASGVTVNGGVLNLFGSETDTAISSGGTE